MKKIALYWQILIGMFLGVLFGAFFPNQVEYVEWAGEIFLTALKMVIIPLILTSVISGVTNIGSGKSLGRLGAKTIGYYLSTSMLAIVTGLLLVNIIQPGIGANIELTVPVEGLDEATESFGDTLKNIVPDNIFLVMTDNQRMLSIIFFALLFGFFITQVEGKHRVFLTDFFQASFEVMMKITLFVIRFTPYGVFAIMAVTVAEQEDIVGLFQSLGMYMLTVIGALLIHAFVILPLYLYFVGKINPVKHFKAMVSALLTAFTTSSSSATLPLTMESVEQNSGVSNKISSFTLPLGATINMDGTALYECVAVLFIAQVYGMEVTLGQQFLVVVTALLASIGAAGIPMAGLVMMTIILSVLNLPLEAVGIIVAVDRPLDMMRTSVNVWSDSCGAAIIASSEGEETKVRV